MMLSHSILFITNATTLADQFAGKRFDILAGKPPEKRKINHLISSVQCICSDFMWYIIYIKNIYNIKKLKIIHIYHSEVTFKH